MGYSRGILLKNFVLKIPGTAAKIVKMGGYWVDPHYNRLILKAVGRATDS